MLESSSTETEFLLPKASIRVDSPDVFDYYERAAKPLHTRPRLNLTKIALTNINARPRLVPTLFAIAAASIIWFFLLRHVQNFWPSHPIPEPELIYEGPVFEPILGPGRSPLTGATPQEIVNFISRTIYVAVFLATLLPGIRLCLKRKAKMIKNLPIALGFATVITAAVWLLKMPPLWYLLNQPGAFDFLRYKDSLEYTEVVLAYAIPFLGILFFLGPLIPLLIGGQKVQEAIDATKGNRIKLGTFVAISNLAWILPFVGAWAMFDVPFLILAAFAFEWHCRNLQSLVPLVKPVE